MLQRIVTWYSCMMMTWNKSWELEMEPRMGRWVISMHRSIRFDYFVSIVPKSPAKWDHGFLWEVKAWDQRNTRWVPFIILSNFIVNTCKSFFAHQRSKSKSGYAFLAAQKFGWASYILQWRGHWHWDDCDRSPSLRSATYWSHNK